MMGYSIKGIVLHKTALKGLLWKIVANGAPVPGSAACWLFFFDLLIDVSSILSPPLHNYFRGSASLTSEALDLMTCPFQFNCQC